MSELFLRLVRFRIREGSDAALFEHYSDRVVPSLVAVPGCLLVALLRPWRGSEHASLTLWEGSEHAAAYDESGVYHRLLRESEPLLVPETNWKVREPPDPDQTLDPGQKEIRPSRYTVAAGDAAGALGSAATGLFVRFAAVRLLPDGAEEFQGLYGSEVLPALAAQPGWRGGFLALAERSTSEALSVTTWRRESDAVRYEMSGEFERLSVRLQDTFSSPSRSRERPSLKMPTVESFELVVGRQVGER